jgi:hypothetical protein
VDSFSVGAVNLGAENTGAGLLINGDGISRGLSFKPSAKNTASTINKTKGMMNLSMAY